MPEKFKIFEMQPRIARAMFDFEDDTRYPVRVFLFDFLVTLRFAYESFYLTHDLFLHFFSGSGSATISVHTLYWSWCSSGVPNFSMSLLPTLTNDLLGSFIADVVDGLFFVRP